MKKNNWKYYRNKWCYLNGKKLKLRKYIVVSAAIMKHKNKPGWHKINHLQNYKNALSIYGFDGLKHYENLFYKDIPLPENQTLKVKFYLWVVRVYMKVKLISKKIR